MDQQQRAVPRPRHRCRQARRLEGRVVRLPVPAIQRRRHQRRGRQHPRLQRHRRPATASTAPNFFEAWYAAGDDQGRAEDAHRSRHRRAYDFSNVLRPGHLHRQSTRTSRRSAACSGRRSSSNCSMIGALPGYYNPANGVTVNFTPTKSFYLNVGVYDGNRARGIQTGINPPMFNGYYFNIGEIGANWHAGRGQPSRAVRRRPMAADRHPVVQRTSPRTAPAASTCSAHNVSPTASIRARSNLGDHRLLPVRRQRLPNAADQPVLRRRHHRLRPDRRAAPHDSMGLGAALSRLNQNIFAAAERADAPGLLPGASVRLDLPATDRHLHPDAGPVAHTCPAP